MSKPKYKWWGYVKNVIRSYPSLKREYENLHEQSMAVNMSGMRGGGAVSRCTENVALRELPKPKQREYDSVRKAIDWTKRMDTGSDRLKLIDLVFWKQSRTLSGASMEVNISYDTAINYHGDFIVLVAFNMDLITYDEIENKKMFALKSQKDVLE